MDSAQLVLRFEHEFKNNANEDWVHHLPCQGMPPGRAGMQAMGEFVTAAIHDIHVQKNHIYRVTDGQITELWPAGGPQLG